MAKYWAKREDDLVIKWKTAIESNNKKEQLNIYNALMPALTIMAESIYNRYFSLGKNNQEQIIQEAITELFCNLHKYDPLRSAKSFSFCQTVIKNYFFDIWYSTSERPWRINIEYYGKEENDEDNYSTRFENLMIYDPNEEDDYTIADVISKLLVAKNKTLELLNGNHYYKYYTIEKLNIDLYFLTLLIEFFVKYGDTSHLSSSAIFDYLNFNSDLNYESNLLNAKLKRFYNEYVSITKISKRNSEALCKKADEKNNRNFYNDDFCPNENKSIHRYYNNDGGIKPIKPKLIKPKPIKSKPIKLKPIKVKPIKPKPIIPKPIKTKLIKTKLIKQKPIERFKPIRPLNYKELGKHYKGVSRKWDIIVERWEAYIHIKRKKIHIGNFSDEDQAAEAYNLKAFELFGEKANLNIIKK